MALKIGILYLAITIIRNIIEPKIVGDHVGMHPVVTLMAMVIGTYVFGPIGLLGLPITIALFKSLNDEGIIHVFNMPEPEPEDKKIPLKEKLRGSKILKKKHSGKTSSKDQDPPEQDETKSESRETEASK
ncbi:MAG: AI-2E family transporter [Clostridia bacterium]|nr:AI-2E family transporter [Clostridia bacterium]